MPFPTKLLAPGEEVVLESHAHWSLLVPRAFVTLLALAGCVAVVIAWSSAPIWVGYILLAVGVIALAWFAARLTTWWSALLVITTSRVIYRTGVVRRVGREIPLNRVQDVSYSQSLLERVVGAGSLMVESAGHQGQEPFPDIRRPAHVQAVINQLLSGDLPPPRPQRDPPASTAEPASRAGWHEAPRVSFAVSGGAGPRSEGAGNPPEPPQSPEMQQPEEPVIDQLERLARLHQAGVLTDAEFESKKRELLRRL